MQLTPTLRLVRALQSRRYDGSSAPRRRVRSRRPAATYPWRQPGPSLTGRAAPCQTC